MPCPVKMSATTLKFVGTISLGLLTGVSYTLTTLSLPSLQLLPSATHASRTLRSLQVTSTRNILSLASISSLSLLTSYWISSPRNKHPYLLYVAIVGFIGGQGLEGWYNGLSRFPKGFRDNWVTRRFVGGKDKSFDASSTSPAKSNRDSGDEWDDLASSEQVNGESVEAEMTREKGIQKIRTLVAGVGFTMGMIGLWGDGA